MLNVFAPAEADRVPRPVMVWVHGGAHTVGSGEGPVYDGSWLAEHRDVVVVTINHRLGVLGYLYLGELLGDRYACSGNVGNLDVVSALEWVRDNIAVFGGDPGNVTLFGESGGGAKVSAVLAMPAGAGLFHRAIIQSGPEAGGAPGRVLRRDRSEAARGARPRGRRSDEAVGAAGHPADRGAGPDARGPARLGDARRSTAGAGGRRRRPARASVRAGRDGGVGDGAAADRHQPGRDDAVLLPRTRRSMGSTTPAPSCGDTRPFHGDRRRSCMTAIAGRACRRRRRRSA